MPKLTQSKPNKETLSRELEKHHDPFAGGRQHYLRRPRRASVVWLYFEFDSEERRRTVCTICGHTMFWDPTSNSTSNMLKHMRNKHPMELEIAKEEESRILLKEEQNKMMAIVEGHRVLPPGLTAGDDRGSSEYSQNDDEGAASGSPEFLGDGNERDPTPAPVAQTPPKPESYQLRHNNHLTIVLEALARDEAFMDVTLTAQGRSLKAHKSVLSAVSPYFRGVLRENPCQHPIIIMPRDVRFEELFSIVNYIYKGEMTVAAEDLTSLLKTAEILQVSGLAPSDSTATVNPHTAGNIRSSSSSSSASSNVPPALKTHKTVKETNQGISIPINRPKSPETMINPSDFMDMDMTYVKEEIQSGGEDEEDTAPSETSVQPIENTSPKAIEIHHDTVSFTSVYNQNQEQTMAPNDSSQDTNNIAPIKTETEREGRPDLEQNKSIIENPLPFFCPHCQGLHRGLDNMSNHLRLNHPTKPSFPCACGRVFTRSSSHQAHVKVCNISS
ncbi:broad-complex core protein isoforms 1/2/3/4/5-like isoform X3 [Palaemon carinicauda]|uniref:broad-complex core protein isoforms 1/2/3/4/5-like isoform X3 n=1 Tax=Palaemon carinicauda TaxID=392227 RepID=UPI0035B5C58F